MLIGGVNKGREVYSSISNNEREFICDGIIKHSVRPDYRSLTDWRVIESETGIIPQAYGSARYKIGQTECIASVKGEIGRPDLQSPSEGRISCLVDCSAVYSLSNEEGEDSSILQAKNVELAYFVSDLCNNLLDKKSLLIKEKTHCWIVSLEVLVLEFDGNLIDCLMGALRLALENSSFPSIKVIPSLQDDVEDELVIGDDEDGMKDINFPLLPITVTIAIFQQSHLVIDPSREEELCCDGAVVLGFTKVGGNILFNFIRKIGSSLLLYPGMMEHLIDVGKQNLPNK